MPSKAPSRLPPGSATSHPGLAAHAPWPCRRQWWKSWPPAGGRAATPWREDIRHDVRVHEGGRRAGPASEPQLGMATDDGLVRTIRFHDLRHAHAAHLLSSGVHPKIASERLGHSKVGITLDLCSHVLPGMQADAAARVDEAMQRAIDRRSAGPTKGEAGQALGSKAVADHRSSGRLTGSLANDPSGLERWQSGRMHRTRNAASLQGLREFESPPLRQTSFNVRLRSDSALYKSPPSAGRGFGRRGSDARPAVRGCDPRLEGWPSG